MSDILQIATTRRTKLKAELTKLDEFLAMAEELSKGGETEADEGLTLARSTMAPKPTVVERPRTTTNGSGSA